MTKTYMLLTIAILSYNTENLLKRCLESIFKYTKGVNFEVIVVDNNSSDNSVEIVRKYFPQVKLVINKKNLFFSGGYNVAIKNAKGKYFIMLNSDTYIINNAFKTLIDWMIANNIKACEGLELRENDEAINTGSHLPSPLIDFYELSLIGKRLANKNLISKFRITNKNRRKNFEIDVGCNAFFGIETQILIEVNGYDERFKLYYTENDLCVRIKEKGYKIYHYGNSYVYHKVAASTSKLKYKRIEIYYHDMLVYYSKYNKYFQGLLLYWLLKFELFCLKTLRKDTGY